MSSYEIWLLRGVAPAPGAWMRRLVPGSRVTALAGLVAKT